MHTSLYVVKDECMFIILVLGNVSIVACLLFEQKINAFRRKRLYCGGF